MKKESLTSGLFLRVGIVALLLVILTFPLAFGKTMADAAYHPEHVLTYTKNKLTWDNQTKIRADGSAELSLFNSYYEHVESADEDKVIAPGTDGSNVVRLKNDVADSIDYTAIVYVIKSSALIPVMVDVNAPGEIQPVDAQVLPEGIETNQVLSCIKGKLNPYCVADINLSFKWPFEGDDLVVNEEFLMSLNEEDRSLIGKYAGQTITGDQLDTLLGNAAAFTEKDLDMTVGVYIIVTDDHTPISPDTGRYGSNMILYLVLGGLCLLMIVLLSIEGRIVGEKR